MCLETYYHELFVKCTRPYNNDAKVLRQLYDQAAMLVMTFSTSTVLIAAPRHASGICHLIANVSPQMKLMQHCPQ